jgi:transposase
MMTSIPRFANNFEGYETVDMKEFLASGEIELHLVRSSTKKFRCHRCATELGAERGRYRLKLEAMPIMGFRTFVYFWRHKGNCSKCKKARAEAVDFIAPETPHLTRDYAWWIGRVCEIAAVSRVGELTNQDETTTWRIDYRRMQRMLAYYTIPEVTQISVDEVYARKKAKHKGESRNDRFFTVVTDLKTHRVIWVSESRSKHGLDQFFALIGEAGREKITLVAMDQHEDYAASVREHCPKATIVWDRFHLMQNFEEAINEVRKDLHEQQAGGSEMKRLSRGKYRYLFLKKENRRTEEERTHINQILALNNRFAKLEIIKERMLSFFDQPDEAAAKAVFDEVALWSLQEYFLPLMKWCRNFEAGWHTVKNYFTHRVTSALSEGINNVIKAIKRRAYGYRNMHYFRLKIMQVCGYLNSRYVATSNQLLTQK